MKVKVSIKDVWGKSYESNTIIPGLCQEDKNELIGYFKITAGDLIDIRG